MANDKEFREFFLRDTQVNSGSKPDQEVGYPTQYYVGSALKFNRFLKNHFPSENSFIKLLTSLTFKLNKEDRAQALVQGLTVIATDANAESRTSNATNGSANTATVMPHQLPEIVLATDGSDAVVGTPAEVGGLKLSILRRTLSGLFRKNYKLEVNTANSVEVNSSSKKVQLVNDSATPGNYYFYSTNGSGTKGWVQYMPTKKKVFEFSNTSINQTLSIGYTADIIPVGGAFDAGYVQTGATSKPKVDYSVQIWVNRWNGSSFAGTYSLVTVDAVNIASINVDETTGDITIVCLAARGKFRLILIG